MKKQKEKQSCGTCSKALFKCGEGSCSFKIGKHSVPFFLEDTVREGLKEMRISKDDGINCKCWSFKEDFPDFVRFIVDREGEYSSALRRGGYNVKDGYNIYYRDAGHWNVEVEIKDGKLFCVNGKKHNMDHCDGRELVECTAQDWMKSNQGYLPEWVLDLFDDEDLIDNDLLKEGEEGENIPF
jgi:hypothetical protein